MVTEYFFAEDIVFRHLYFDSQGGMVPRYFEFGGDCVFLVQDGGAIQLYVCDFESGMEVFFEPYIVVDIQESGRASHVNVSGMGGEGGSCEVFVGADSVGFAPDNEFVFVDNVGKEHTLSSYPKPVSGVVYDSGYFMEQGCFYGPALPGGRVVADEAFVGPYPETVHPVFAYTVDYGGGVCVIDGCEFVFFVV